MDKIRFFSSLFSMSDEQAMWRVRTQDDHRAFAHLVGRWEEPIRRFCARLTGDPHRAEDLKQETFARVFVKRRSFQPAARFSPWLWRIALNLCYDELRRINRRGESPFDPDGGETLAFGGSVADAPTPHTQLAAREEGELVRRALLQLPDIYRTALVLRHYENLKLREIAEILEVPEGTVNSRLAEGLARLTRILEPQLDGPPGRFDPGHSHGTAHANRPPQFPSAARGNSSTAPHPNLPMKTVEL